MKAIETPIGKCFSNDAMEGAWYHENLQDKESEHTFHRYDKDGICILYSTKRLSDMPKNKDFYISDRFGNKM